MGFYINEDSKGSPLPKFGKAEALKKDGAILIQGNVPFQKNLICVADKMTYEAAIYCYDEREYDRVCAGNRGMEDRVSWLIHPLAGKLSGFDE